MIEEAARTGLFGAETTAAMLVLARDMRVHELHLKEDPGPVIQFLSTKTSKSALVWTGLHRSYRRYRRKI